MHLKDKAYNLNLLKQSQRCWILIRNSIHCLAPKPIITLPKNSSSIRKTLFQAITGDFYINTMDYLAYFNAFLYIISVFNQEGFYAIIIGTYFNI